MVNEYLRNASRNSPVPRTSCQSNKLLCDKELLLDHVDINKEKLNNGWLY